MHTAHPTREYLLEGTCDPHDPPKNWELIDDVIQAGSDSEAKVMLSHWISRVGGSGSFRLYRLIPRVPIAVFNDKGAPPEEKKEGSVAAANTNGQPEIELDGSESLVGKLN